MFYEKRTMIENIMASNTIDQKLDLSKIHKKNHETRWFLYEIGYVSIGIIFWF